MQAEEVNIKGRVYHKKCLSCKNCKRPIDISLLAIGPDEDIYCQICCNKISWPGNYAGASDTTLIAGDDGEPTNCPRCNGKVCIGKKNKNIIEVEIKPAVTIFLSDSNIIIEGKALRVFSTKKI